MTDPYTGKKIVSPLDLCSLSIIGDNGKTYTVTTQKRITPAAAFPCFHCASKWRDDNMPHADVHEVAKSLAQVFQPS